MLQVKDICHIWELGGGTLFTNLLASGGGPLNSGTLKSLTVILMIDLSSLSSLWTTMETLLNSIKAFILQHKESDSLILTAKKRIPMDHPVSKLILL